jgi:hypothetical protein
MPHNEHNVIPFCNKLNDSNGRMRYLSFSLSLVPRIRRVVTHSTLFSKGKVIMIIIVVVTIGVDTRVKND